MSDPNSLGELIRERRLAAGLSLGQLANKVGRTAATVRAWERDQHFPASDVVERLAMALDVDVDQIRDFMQREPPSLTVVSDEPDDDATPSESTSVSGDAKVETAEGEGDDDTAEIGAVESAPAAAAEVEASFVAASADELGIIPKIEAPEATEDEEAAEKGPEAGEADDGGPEDGDTGVAAAVVAVAESSVDADADVEASEEVAPDAEAPPEPSEEPAPVGPAAETGDEPLLEEAPTEAIGPPISSGGQATAQASTSVVVRAELMEEPNLPPILAPLRTIFDPNRRWLYWIRGALTLVAMLVVFVALVWAIGELFDGIGEVLDTIDSTEPLEGDEVPLN